MIYEGKTIEGIPCSQWKAIQREAATFPHFKIKVYTAEPNISDQQRKYLYCKAGPIAYFVDRGLSKLDAKNLLKVHYGRDWFVVPLTNENVNKVSGYFRWECTNAVCRGLYHPMEVYVEKDLACCPNCRTETLQPIAIRSIMDVSTKNTYLWFNEIFQAHPQIKKPTPNLDPRK